MKRYTTLFVVVTVLVTTILFNLGNAVAEGQWMQVSELSDGDHVNVRDAANGNDIGDLTPGARVWVTETSDVEGQTWAHITRPVDGWVLMSLLEPLGQNVLQEFAPNEPTPVDGRPTYSIGAVNVRSAPFMGNNILMVAPAGSHFRAEFDAGDWYLGPVVSPEGTYLGSGYINKSASNLQQIDNFNLVLPDCEYSEYTPIQANVWFGDRHAFYVDAVNCTVIFDGQIVEEEGQHDIVELIEVAFGNRVVSAMVVNGFFAVDEGTFAHYPAGNQFNAPELGSDFAWTLTEGWARDVRERLDARPDEWNLTVYHLDGTQNDYGRDEYPESAQEGSKTYTTCDGMVAPEELPVNADLVVKDGNAVFNAAVGAQGCLTLFVGDYNGDGNLDAFVFDTPGPEISENFSYYNGVFYLIPQGWSMQQVQQYLMTDVAPLYGDGASFNTSVLPDHPHATAITQ